MYQDCYYKTKDGPARQKVVEFSSMSQRFKNAVSAPIGDFPPGTRDMSHQINYDSTDNDFGFQCWANEQTYFNNLEVKKALHVLESRLNVTWCSCCNIPYTRTYFDMADTFSYILQNSNIRILIYNGDVDLVCNFLGDQWFVERQVAPQNKLQVQKPRTAWNYRKQIAGFVKRYERLDLLTVKGSGHFVPTDRAGPALQMIFNFIRNTGDYSRATGIDVTPKPVNP